MIHVNEIYDEPSLPPRVGDAFTRTMNSLPFAPPSTTFAPYPDLSRVSPVDPTVVITIFLLRPTVISVVHCLLVSIMTDTSCKMFFETPVENRQL